MSENFLLRKNVDRSLLNRGFAIPAEMQAVFSLHLSGGTLSHGEKRTIKIILNDETFDATNLLIVCPNHHRVIHAANPPSTVRKNFTATRTVTWKVCC